MDFLNPTKQIDPKLAVGKLLIAEPFLSDINFVRAVVLLCEHSESGSVGFILNRPTNLTLGDLLPELETPELYIHQGGPVQMDTLHMLHRMPKLVGGNEIIPGIFWGGSYEALKDVVSNDLCTPTDLKLFVGYSGWAPGQLEKELGEGSWLVSDVNPKILFETDNSETWRQAIYTLGKDFSYLANMPINPQLN
jgi:putative transcriptional regulator